MSAGGQASAVGRATSALTFFSPHLAIITLLWGRGVRRLPLSHLSYGFCPRLSVIWRSFSVRCLSGILPLPFSLSGISGQPFSLSVHVHTFLAVCPCVCNVYHTHAHKVPGCSCSWYSTHTKFPAAAAAGTAPWSPTFDMKTYKVHLPRLWLVLNSQPVL